MPDLVTTANQLKGVPDQWLQKELAAPTGAVPSYLVLAEAQRRATLRSGGASQKQQQASSVYDDVLRNLTSGTPPPGPPTPPGMASPPSGLGQMAQGAPPPPQNFKPPQAMATGGSVDDEDDEDNYTPPSTGSASRSVGKDQYDKYVEDSAGRHNVDPDLVRAVIQNESNFKRSAVSPKGATGLMQLMPGTARDMGVKDRKNPQQSIEGGTKYLRWLGDTLKTDNPDLILAGYNAGPGAVQRYGRVPPYKETKNYINKVKGTLYSLKKDKPAAEPATEQSLASTETTPRTETMPQTAEAEIAPGSGLAALTETPQPGGSTPPAEATAPTTSTEAATPAPAPTVETKSTAARSEEDADPYSEKNIQRQRKLFERLYGSKAEPGAALKAEIARIRAESARLAKPSGWQMLADFGWGMAASPAHSLFSQIGAGGQAMSKGMADRMEEARKQQLALLGIDVKLDDQMRDSQDKIVQLTGQAVNQAANKQISDFERLRSTDGAIPGNSNESPGSGYRFEPNPTGGKGLWLPPTTSTVTKEMTPFVKGMINPATGKTYRTNDAIPRSKADEIEKEMLRAAGRGVTAKPTVASTRNASAVDQFYAKHPELPRPVDADGAPKDPSTYVLTDVPPELQAEASYYGQLLSGMTKSKAEDLIANGTPEQKQLGQKFLDIHNKQVGAEAGARTKGVTEAFASELTPGTLDLYSEQYINGKFASKNPAMLAIVGNAAAEKLKARGMTSQAALIERNAAEANKSALTELTKVNAAANAFSDTAVAAMTNLDSAAKEVADLGIPILNTPLRDLSSKFAGNPKVVAFRAALTPVQTDIARILSSPRLTGVLTDSAREEMKPALGEGATYRQLLAAMNVFYKDMEGRKAAYEKEMGLLQKMSVVGQAIAPKAGATETPAAGGAATPKAPRKATLNGRTIVAREGSWYYEDNGEKVEQ